MTRLEQETGPAAGRFSRTGGSDAEGGIIPADDMVDRATEAAAFLKALAHEGRMMILCHLSAGEKTVTELESLLGQRQAAVSQQLARLRAEGLVSCRREGKARLYSVSDARAAEVVGLMYRLFCAR